MIKKRKRKAKLFTNLLKIFSAIIIIAIICVVGVGCYALERIGTRPDQAAKQRFSTLSNYQADGFKNLEPTSVQAGPKSLSSKEKLKFIHGEGNTAIPEFPQVKLTGASFDTPTDNLSLIWIGHSTILFEMNNLRFITDPVFGNAAPIPMVMNRYAPPPIKRADLPKLDFVLLTHDHYDHLEYDFIKQYKESNLIFVAPLGVSNRLISWGIKKENIRELNWFESTTIGSLKITLTPALHFSGRYFDDRNLTLWGSYVIEGNSKIFFGGDSGYGKHFKDIGEKFGPFDLVCLEIDAWNERWPNSHSFPSEVITEFKDLRGQLLFPMHWGVFKLAMHNFYESIEQVDALSTAENIPILTPVMGQKVTIYEETAKWWKPLINSTDSESKSLNSNM